MNYIWYKGFKIQKSTQFNGWWHINPMHGASLSRPYPNVEMCKNQINYLLERQKNLKIK